MTGRFEQALTEMRKSKKGRKGKMPKKFSVKSGDKSAAGGLTAKGVKRYRAANPGSKLKTAVTTKPSKLKKGSKSAKRRKSFCARMGGMKKRLTSAKTRRDPDSRINKALRKWNCSTDVNPNALQQMAEMVLESLLENRYGNKKNRTGKKQRLGQFRKERNTAANQGEDKTERGQKILRTAGGISRGGGPRPKFRASTSQQDFEAGKMSTLRGRKSRDDIYDPNAKADLPQGEPEKKDRVAQARSAMAGAFGGAKSALGRARAGGSAFMSGLKRGWKQGTTPTPLFRKKKPAKRPDDTETEIDKQNRVNSDNMYKATGIRTSTEIVRNARQGLAEMILNGIQESGLGERPRAGQAARANLANSQPNNFRDDVRDRERGGDSRITAVSKATLAKADKKVKKAQGKNTVTKTFGKKPTQSSTTAYGGKAGSEEAKAKPMPKSQIDRAKGDEKTIADKAKANQDAFDNLMKGLASRG